jgi:hypothetical protein
MKQKTAMQQLMDLMSEQPFTFGNAINLVIINELLEKEKEQIIKSWENGYSIGCVVGSNDYTNEDEEKDNGNYYYNQTYKNERIDTNNDRVY